jgi:hypothetical protein
MRRLLLLIGAMLLAAAVATPVAGAVSLTGSFSVQFPKGHAASSAPCAEDAFCGVGTLAHFGAATITILDETFEEIEGSSCLLTTRVERIDLADDTGTLVIESAGTFCRPGASADSQASPSSYGSPGRWRLTFTVIGSESVGVFASATGGGVETMRSNGGIGVWHLSGSIQTS